MWIEVRSKVLGLAVGTGKSIGINIEFSGHRKIFIRNVVVLMPLDMRNFRWRGKETQRGDDLFLPRPSREQA
jgi:hypothetical protein